MMEVLLRPAGPEDDGFFRRVYGSTREDELALVGWDEATASAFLDHQFRAQSEHYSQHYPHAEVHVITVQGRPAGRLFVDRDDAEIRVVDISLLPDFRGLGIGTRLLTGLLREAEVRGQSVRLHVEHDNPARHLYERLGFRCAEHGPVYDRLEWRRALAS